MEVKHIETLSTDEIKLLARDQAESGDPCQHNFEPGSPRAQVYERAYLEYQIQHHQAQE